jgi:hypothetical protein
MRRFSRLPFGFPVFLSFILQLTQQRPGAEEAEDNANEDTKADKNYRNESFQNASDLVAANQSAAS